MRRYLVLAVLVLCAGCTVGPDFAPSTVDRSVTFHPTPENVASHTYGGAVDTAWWKIFKDPELDALVDRLATQNLDLLAATERVSQARAQVRLSQAQNFPQLNGGASYARQRLSENGVVTQTLPSPGAPLMYDQFDLGLTASWELDLFGRVRRQTEAARASVEASIEDRHGVALAVVAELAVNYFQYRQMQALEALTRSNIAISERRLSLVNELVQYGAVPDLNSAQAQSQLAQIRKTLPAILARKAALSNAIALLLAEPPRALDEELDRVGEKQPGVPKMIAIGLPADIIRQRPDIRRSEAQLHEATAMTGAAIASFYPDVTFSSGFGLDGLHTGSLFDWASRTFSIMPSLSLPIFHGGALEGNRQMAEAKQREAGIAFRQVVLNAWHEVDNALVAYAYAQQTQADANAATEADERTLKLANEQFNGGAGDFLNVTDAQSALQASQSMTVEANAQLEIALVNLYRSLGGGWQRFNGAQVAELSPK